MCLFTKTCSHFEIQDLDVDAYLANSGVHSKQESLLLTRTNGGGMFWGKMECPRVSNQPYGNRNINFKNIWICPNIGSKSCFGPESGFWGPSGDGGPFSTISYREQTFLHHQQKLHTPIALKTSERLFTRVSVQSGKPYLNVIDNMLHVTVPNATCNCTLC